MSECRFLGYLRFSSVSPLNRPMLPSEFIFTLPNPCKKLGLERSSFRELSSFRERSSFRAPQVKPRVPRGPWLPTGAFMRTLSERYTEEVKEALFLSFEESLRLGHVGVGTSSILVGLLLGPENMAAKVLKSMGISAEDVRKAADKISNIRSMGPLGRRSGMTGLDNIPFTASGIQSLVASYKEARKRGHTYIGSGHLLLAILVSDEDGSAALVLANLGANITNIRAEVTRMLGEDNNETISEIVGGQPSIEDVAKVDEELRELQKKRDQLILSSVKDGEKLNGIDHLILEIFLLEAKRDKLRMWCSTI